MDYRLVTRFCRGPSDFVEGVRALLIDKCGQPRWDPPSIDQARPAAAPGGVHARWGRHPALLAWLSMRTSRAGGACFDYYRLVRKDYISAEPFVPGLCLSHAFGSASQSEAGRHVVRTVHYVAVTQRCLPAQVDPERVADFFKPLPPEEELQLHEPHILLEHSSKL